jgi:hypothetical protein
VDWLRERPGVMEELATQALAAGKPPEVVQFVQDEAAA